MRYWMTRGLLDKRLIFSVLALIVLVLLVFGGTGYIREGWKWCDGT